MPVASVIRVPLSNGGYSLVDAADWEQVGVTFAAGHLIEARPCDIAWNGQVRQSGIYARSNVWQCEKNITIYLHRLVMSAPQGLTVDHRDHNGLNNCRDNLRLCPQSDNIHNQRKRKSRHRFKGTRFHRGGWEVQVAGSYVGRFGDEEQAARAYDAAAIEAFGEFALLNFPIEAKS